MNAKRTPKPQDIEITPEMVVAGVKRLRESLCESDESLVGSLVVLEILETALATRRGARRSSLTLPLKKKILNESERLLEDL